MEKHAVEAVTLEHEERILGSPATHGLVYKVLALTKGHDPVDALYDVECALAILMGRWDRMKGGA